MSPVTNKTALIRTSPFFQGLSDESFAFVEERTIRRRFEDGQAIYRRGDKADAFWGIMSGRVYFSAESAEGKAMTTSFVDAGEWFGNIGVFDGGPRIVDATANGPTELVMLASSDLMDLCHRDVQVLWRVVDMMGAQLRMVGQLLEESVFHGLPVRLARRLLELDESHGITVDDGRLIDLHLPQEELGRMAGVTREATGRQLTQWRRNGWLDINYGKITIRNRTALVSIVTLAGMQNGGPEVTDIK